MTINVAVKCANGLVLGTDSLAGISVDGQIRYLDYYTNKLFAFRDYPVSAILNGVGNIGARSIEDLINEFVENLPSYNADTFLLSTLVSDLLDFLQAQYQAANSMVRFELIVAGFTSTHRSSEIYSIDFPNATITGRYTSDIDYGIYYSGQPDALDRFRYGLDLEYLIRMAQYSTELWNQAVNSILNQLRDQGVNIPDNVQVRQPPLDRFNIFEAVSDALITPQTTLENILEEAKLRYRSPYSQMSLQEAINLTVFLLHCAYAEQNLTLTPQGRPAVGGQMIIATITREKGFQMVKQWDLIVSDILTQ